MTGYYRRVKGVKREKYEDCDTPTFFYTPPPPPPLSQSQFCRPPF